MDIETIKKHFAQNLSYDERYNVFKSFWETNVLPVAQDAVGDDADYMFKFMNESAILNEGKFFEKLKVRIIRFFRFVMFKKHKSTRMDWYAVYFIVNMMAKVNECIKKRSNPTVEINSLLTRLGSKEYYNKFPNHESEEVMRYKLLAIRLYQCLEKLDFYNATIKKSIDSDV